MEPVVAALDDVLLGTWAMILVAGVALAGLAIGLPIAIVKALGLVESLFMKATERTAKTDRARSPDVVGRSRREPSLPG